MDLVRHRVYSEAIKKEFLMGVLEDLDLRVGIVAVETHPTPWNKKKKDPAMSMNTLSAPANDNLDNDLLAFITGLKNTLNAKVEEKTVRDIVQKEILEFNCLNKIELKQGEVITTLPDKNRHFLFPEILQAVNCNIPVALIGPAGSGKSTVCEQIAEALKLKFYLQNSVSGAHELAGYCDAYGKYQTTPFRTAFEKGGLVLVDEVDTSEAAALKWINTALANGHAVFPDKEDPITRHTEFRIVIAANTYGTGADRMYVGANQMDASTLDRFCFFDFKYDEKLETMLSGNYKWATRVQKIRRAVADEKARVVVSPRATIYGSILLAAGWKQQTVEDRVIWKGMDLDLKSRIMKRAA